jgi:calcineurin-like phosphoesterase family protein
LGDYSYESSENCWFSKSSPIDSKMRVSIGNHDDSSTKLNQILNNYPLITSKLYYSFNSNGIHFLALATDVDFSIGSAQYKFVVNDLKNAASNPDIKWIIPFFHRPMVIPPTTLAPEPNKLRDIYQPIFETYGVKLVLYGHVHYYLRTYQIIYNPSNPTNPKIVSKNPDTYNTASGIIYAAVGTGGSFFTGMKTPPSYVKTEFQEHGYLHVNMLNDGKTLSAKFYATDGKILDNFTINK